MASGLVGGRLRAELFSSVSQSGVQRLVPLASGTMQVKAPKIKKSDVFVVRIERMPASP